ncbi:GrdX family protein [Haloimpatiens sp. FM7330]|uniref:GrdX family protein n=1 Tax=Haloimpatiens sp. FM7330 TaxID=3298610 RepID=UPI003631FDA9
MIERMMVITNNPLSKDKLANEEKVQSIEYIDGTYMDVLKKTRDYIHKGHKLLTHPLMSSLKPNETPYRTVCISSECGNNINMKSLSLIENAIMATEKFLKIGKNPKWTQSILKDFQVIDYDLIYHALN